MAGTMVTTRLVGVKEELTPFLAYINANRAPLYMNLVALGRTGVVGQPKIAWVDYSSEGTQTILTKAVSSNSETSFTVENGSIFKEGCLATIGDEVIEISSISENTLTVKRGQLTTKAADSYKIGEEVFFINDNIEEGADLQGATYKKGVNYDNNVQIIREEISVSASAEAITVPSAGGIDAYSLEQMKKMDKVLGKIEKAIISGKKFESGLKRGMDGVKRFLAKGQLVDAGGQEISLEIIGNVLRKIFEAGGDVNGGNYALYVPGVQKVKISKLLKDYIQAPPSENTLGAVANYVATDFGTLPIIPTVNLRADEMMILNHDDITLQVLRTRELQHEYMGKTGDNTKGLIVTELSVEVRNIPTMGMIMNLKK
ncbi:hypothetical protein FSBG_00329 [Fusobacterium gonidiaformans 3-1-5R]|uniref:Uncharacterized protein n=2 Tax=Fusobacterium TaxID=848 RepID=E5BFF1_9FUSO|nr:MULTISPECIES: DUF5309 family protein [Fusobacterium]EFS20832.1 hypothetical protein FSBG_00329 [Fusobacterium gonidiaformans 3-1-5R]KXA13382.1 hypothetical protein HMPREF3206_01458 [Fusobacterium equinum]